jgi:hypothetical protein
MKMDWEGDVYINIFLALALVGGELSVSRPCRFNSGERASGTHFIGWMDPKTGLNDIGNLTLSGLEIRPLGRPARSQSLYRMRYRCLVEKRRLSCLASNLTPVFQPLA